MSTQQMVLAVTNPNSSGGTTMRSEEKQRILTMVASGRLSPEEADRLLSSLEQPKPGFPWRSLLNPFAHLPLAASLSAAAVVAGAGLVLAQALGIRFDGALDVHLASSSVAWTTALLDHVVSWPLLALSLWLAVRAAGRQGRFVDMLAATGVARLALLLGALVLAWLMPAGLAGADTEQAVRHALAPQVILAALATLPLLAAFVVWLVLGFRTASGLRGGRLAASFVGALVVAELVSKLLLWAAQSSAGLG